MRTKLRRFITVSIIDGNICTFTIVTDVEIRKYSDLAKYIYIYIFFQIQGRRAEDDHEDLRETERCDQLWSRKEENENEIEDGPIGGLPGHKILDLTKSKEPLYEERSQYWASQARNQALIHSRPLEQSAHGIIGRTYIFASDFEEDGHALRLKKESPFNFSSITSCGWLGGSQAPPASDLLYK